MIIPYIRWSFSCDSFSHFTLFNTVGCKWKGHDMILISRYRGQVRDHEHYKATPVLRGHHTLKKSQGLSTPSPSTTETRGHDKVRLGRLISLPTAMVASMRHSTHRDAAMIELLKLCRVLFVGLPNRTDLVYVGLVFIGRMNEWTKNEWSLNFRHI